jgi:hypothetical protein
VRTRKADFVKTLAGAVMRRDQHREWSTSLEEPRASYERHEADRKLEAYFGELFDALESGIITLAAPKSGPGHE